MKKCIIGYTGFVGSNLSNQMQFDDYYNSKNINSIKNKTYDLVICAGIRAEKYLANKYPKKDLNNINILIEALKTVSCKKFILISTIDVYSNISNVNENSKIDKSELHPYGQNRLYMEEWVKTNFQNYSIVRLPALFGKWLKKNFIYDCITKIPSMITPEKFHELTKNDKTNMIYESYIKNDNGFFQLNNGISKNDKQKLINILESLNFTSQVFTDSRSTFPFYYLGDLPHHIDVIIKNDIKLVNLTNEPLSTKEVAKKVFGFDFVNENLLRAPTMYNIRTIYDKELGGENGYIHNKETVLKQISNFIKVSK